MKSTQAIAADLAVRQHLAAIVVVAQEAPDDNVARMARSEMCRLVSAICTALGPHRIDSRGECEACRSESCGLRDGIKRTLLPVRLP